MGGAGPLGDTATGVGVVLKRIFDLLASVALLAALLPLMVTLAAAIKLTMPGPVLYRGSRVGLNGSPFRMLKFRSMIVNADHIGASSTAAADPRMTPLGKGMRRYKLDELPHLERARGRHEPGRATPAGCPWAVERYTEEEKILLTVRPGVTDPASLRFANEGEILRGRPDPDRAYFELIHPEKMRLSIYYVKNRSFLGDLKILVVTVGAALGRRPGGTGLPEQDTSTT